MQRVMDSETPYCCEMLPVSATLEEDRLKSRGVRRDEGLRAEVETVRRTPLNKSQLTIPMVDRYLVTA